MHGSGYGGLNENQLREAILQKKKLVQGLDRLAAIRTEVPPLASTVHFHPSVGVVAPATPGSTSSLSQYGGNVLGLQRHAPLSSYTSSAGSTNKSGNGRASSNDTYEKRISMLNEIAQLQAQNASLRIDARRMIEEHARTEKNHNDLKLRHEDLQRLYEGSQAQIASLQNEQARLKAEVQVLLSTSAQGHTILLQQKERQALQQELMKAHAEITELGNQHTEMKRMLSLEEEKFAKAVRALVGMKKGLNADESNREGEMLMDNFDRAIASNTVAAEAIRGLQEQWSARALELRREEKEAEVQLVMRYVAEQYEAVMRTHSDTELRQRFRQLLSQLGYTCGSLTAATLMVVSQREILATEREKVSHLEQENKTLKDDLVKNEEKRKNLEIELADTTTALKLANQRDSKLESERKESAAALAHAQVNYEELKKKHEPVEQQIRQLLEEKKVSDEAARARDARLVAAEAELEAVRSQLMQETQTTSAERLKTTEALASLESANRAAEHARVALAKALAELEEERRIAGVRNVALSIQSSTSSSIGRTVSNLNIPRKVEDDRDQVEGKQEGRDSYGGTVDNDDLTMKSFGAAIREEKTNKSTTPVNSNTPLNPPNSPPMTDDKLQMSSSTDVQPKDPAPYAISDSSKCLILQNEVDELKGLLKQRDLQHTVREVELSSLQAEASTLLSELRAAQNEIASLKKQVRQKDKQLANVRTATPTLANKGGLGGLGVPRTNVSILPGRNIGGGLSTPTLPGLSTPGSSNTSSSQGLALLAGNSESSGQNEEGKDGSSSADDADDYLHQVLSKEREKVHQANAYMGRLAAVLKTRLLKLTDKSANVSAAFVALRHSLDNQQPASTDAQVLQRVLVDFVSTVESHLEHAQMSTTNETALVETRRELASLKAVDYPGQVDLLKESVLALTAENKIVLERLNRTQEELRVLKEQHVTTGTTSVAGQLRLQLMTARQAHAEALQNLAQTTSQLHAAQQALRSASDELAHTRHKYKVLSEEQSTAFVQISALKGTLAEVKAEAASAPPIIERLRGALASANASAVSMNAEISSLHAQLQHLRALHNQPTSSASFGFASSRNPPAPSSNLTSSSSSSSSSSTTTSNANQGGVVVSDPFALSEQTNKVLERVVAAANTLTTSLAAGMPRPRKAVTSSFSSLLDATGDGSSASNPFDLLHIALTHIERDYPFAQHVTGALTRLLQSARKFPEALDVASSSLTKAVEEIDRFEAVSLDEAASAMSKLATTLQSQAPTSGPGAPFADGLASLLLKVAGVYRWVDKTRMALHTAISAHRASANAAVPLPSTTTAGAPSGVYHSSSTSSQTIPLGAARLDTNFLAALSKALASIKADAPASRLLVEEVATFAGTFQSIIGSIAKIDSDLETALTESNTSSPDDSVWLSNFRGSALRPILHQVPALSGFLTRVYQLTGKHASVLESVHNLKSVLAHGHEQLASIFADDSSDPAVIRSSFHGLSTRLVSQATDSQLKPFARQLSAVLNLAAELAEHRSTSLTLSRALADFRQGLSQVMLHLAVPNHFVTTQRGSTTSKTDTFSPPLAIEHMHTALRTLAATHSPIAAIMGDFITFMSQVHEMRVQLSQAPSRSEVLALKQTLSQTKTQLLSLERATEAQRSLIESASSMRSSLKRHLGAVFAPADDDGVLVTRIVAGGSAEHCGLRADDIIQAVNSLVVSSMSEFQVAVDTYLRDIGSSAALLVKRRGTFVPILLHVGAQGIPYAQLNMVLMLCKMGITDWAKLKLTSLAFPEDDTDRESGQGADTNADHIEDDPIGSSHLPDALSARLVARAPMLDVDLEMGDEGDDEG